jgi:hypothetical protein
MARVEGESNEAIRGGRQSGSAMDRQRRVGTGVQGAVGPADEPDRRLQHVDRPSGLRPVGECRRLCSAAPFRLLHRRQSRSRRQVRFPSRRCSLRCCTGNFHQRIDIAAVRLLEQQRDPAVRRHLRQQRSFSGRRHQSAFPPRVTHLRWLQGSRHGELDPRRSGASRNFGAPLCRTRRRLVRQRHCADRRRNACAQSLPQYPHQAWRHRIDRIADDVSGLYGARASRVAGRRNPVFADRRP